MKTIARLRRHKRITKKLTGDAKTPRLVAFRSSKHIYAQLINDAEQKVITGCSTLSQAFSAKKIKSTNIQAAKEIGKMIAERALSLGIKDVCFDRGGYKYHGRIKSLADGAREGGLKF
jgi:large subunit ribosomal protein L18